MEARESIGTKKVETKWKKSRKWSDSVSKKRVQECCGDAISETSMKQWIPLNEFKWKPMAATIRRVYKAVEQVSLWLALHLQDFLLIEVGGTNNRTAQPLDNTHFVRTSHWLQAGPEREPAHAHIPEEAAEPRGDYSRERG